MRLEGRLIAAAAIGLALVGCDGVPPTPAGLRPAEPHPGIAREFSPPVLKTNEQWVKEAAQKLAIPANLEEVRMWTAFRVNSPPIIPSSLDFEVLLKTRYLAVKGAMENSKNTYLEQTKNFIDAPDKKLFTIELHSMLFDESGNPLTAQIITRARDGKIFHTIRLNADWIVNGEPLNGINLAFELVRLMAFVEQMREYQTLPPKEVRQKVNAHAVAQEVEAYITSYGQGYRGGVSSRLEQHAATFVRFGSNPGDPRWIDYVERIIHDNSQASPPTSL